MDADFFAPRHTSCSKALLSDQRVRRAERRRIAFAIQPWRKTIDVLWSNGIVGENPRGVARPDGPPQRGCLDGRQNDRARSGAVADLEMVSAGDGLRGY